MWEPKLKVKPKTLTQSQLSTSPKDEVRMWLRRKSRGGVTVCAGSGGVATPPSRPFKSHKKIYKASKKTKKKTRRTREPAAENVSDSMQCGLSVCLRPLRVTKIITIIVHNTKSKCQLPKDELRHYSIFTTIKRWMLCLECLGECLSYLSPLYFISFYLFFNFHV